MRLKVGAQKERSPALDEEKLLREARQFDERALASIYEMYHDAICRYIYHHLGDVQTAQDLASEVFRRFLQALRNDRGPTEKASSWLYRVAHNLIVDELRRRTYRNHEPLDEMIGDERESPEETARTAIAIERVRQALVHLTPDQRQVVVLKFLEGKDNSEIAAIMGRTVNAVKALQHRALCTLRTQLRVDRRQAPSGSVLEHAPVLSSL